MKIIHNSLSQIQQKRVSAGVFRLVVGVDYIGDLLRRELVLLGRDDSFEDAEEDDRAVLRL